MRDQAGVALIEALVSITLLGLGIYPAFEIFARSTQNATTAQNVAIVSNVANQALEQLRAVPYSSLALSHNSSIPASSSSYNPRSRVTTVSGNDYYQVPGGSTEDMVSYNSGATYSDYNTITVGTGTAARTVAVYRFVSWRDEECPIIDASSLTGAISSLKSNLGALTTAGTGEFAQLLGSSGLVNSTLTNVNSLLSSALINTTLLPIKGTLQSLQSDLGSPFGTNLTTLQTSSSNLLTKLNSLDVTQALDLCDLPAGTTVPSLADMSAASTAIGSVKSQLDTMIPAISDAKTRTGNLVSNLLNVLGLGGLVSSNSSALASDHTTIVGKPALSGITDSSGNAVSYTNLHTLLDTETTNVNSLLSLLSSANTTHNTKRITVAAWLLNPPANSGPQRPIWATTVVTNPQDGLL